MFSKLMNPTRGRSFYEELRAHDDGDDHVALDIEDRAGALDQENLKHEFHDYDLDHADGLASDEDMRDHATRPSAGRARGRQREGGHRQTWPSHDDDDGDNNDVPASLLVELRDGPLQQSRRNPVDPHGSVAIPGPTRARAQWQSTQAQQRLHSDDPFVQQQRHGPGGPGGPGAFLAAAARGNAKKKAEWRWANISNLDNFMKEVYDYFVGCGIWCILLERVLHLVNVSFVALLLTFLSQCVDYSRLRNSQKLSEILVPQCTRNMSWVWNIALWMFAFYFIWKSIQYLLDVQRLINVRDFYMHLLNIPEHDMQTVTWQDVVARIMALRDQNATTAVNLTPAQRRFLACQSKERLDASDIANRLMRRENYLIAMINKDILDLTIPIPFLRNHDLLSRTLEWTLMFSILDFVFDERGQVSSRFLKSDRRGELSKKLQQRFTFAGFMILILSPFVAGYLIIVYFLTYYNEYQKNPSVLGSRTYTPLAEWKFREFNELPHLFRKRLDMSHPFATHYVDQFPKAKTEMVARTVAFISGALAAILAIVSVFDPEMFLSFEITHDRTVLFYTAVFGGIWAFARGSVSEENTVFDPEYALRNVIEYTHYQPDHWQDRLHSFDVKKEFSELYKIKLVIFVEEILSILTTPFVLFSSLPKSSDQIVDFFREFTIHVDGLGYVCSFAEFDFKRGVDRAKRGPSTSADVRDDYYATKHGKMEASYYGFIGNYGNHAVGGIAAGKPGSPQQAHLPAGMRQQFHPPPAWPGGAGTAGMMSSPNMAGGDLQASRTTPARIARPRSRAPPPTRTPRFGQVMPQFSPMASILLDPHHQPAALAAATNKSIHRSRRPHTNGGSGSGGSGGGGGVFPGDGNIIEESVEDTAAEESDLGRRQQEEEDADVYESGAALDESAWQVSANQTLSRDSSKLDGGREADAGVVHMIKQFNQAHLSRRPGVIR